MIPAVWPFPSSYDLFYEYVMLISYTYVLLHVILYISFSGGSAGKESACNAGETWVRTLGWEDPLEKAKATYSSILAWRIPRTV